MIINDVKDYCSKILDYTECEELPFHNKLHTQEVAHNVKVIGRAMEIALDKLEPVIVAAWFHDTGFCELYQGHEQISAELAKEFLKSKKYPTKRIDIVVSCIEATQMPQNPKNLFAEILCDADIFHVSNENFFYKKLLLRREWEVFLGKFYTDKEWHELNLKFLDKHKFFTSYGKAKLDESQHSNRNKVRTLLKYYC